MLVVLEQENKVAGVKGMERRTFTHCISFFLPFEFFLSNVKLLFIFKQLNTIIYNWEKRIDGLENKSEEIIQNMAQKDKRDGKNKNKKGVERYGSEEERQE